MGARGLPVPTVIASGLDWLVSTALPGLDASKSPDAHKLAFSTLLDEFY
jgi:hypothetical protein